MVYPSFRILDRFDIMAHLFYQLACDETTYTNCIRVAMELDLYICEHDLFHSDSNIIDVYCYKENHWFSVNF